ncbi:MAG: ATP-dependent helicase [Caldisphaeraceae archaeon]|nr:ATP-dependent helicase [Caldisphaeraceae archaeon]
MKDNEILLMLRPYVARWFKDTFHSFTEPQRYAIPLIKQGKNVLISSPTGTGKTLSAFLAIIDDLYTLAEKDELQKKIYAIYISPLRALDNDMQKNLLKPLREIQERCKKEGIELPAIRVGLRTSDTPSNEKQKMLRDPPHIIITTPESLAISLSAPRFREKLSSVRWVIIDEIHELASSKRGAHLSLSLERLEYLVHQTTGSYMQRIGLSATISPLDEVARFLGGYMYGRPRDVEIIDARFTKPFDIRVITPNVDLIHGSAEEINNEIYGTIAKLVSSSKTTLIFTNTRSATERVSFKLKRLFSDKKAIDLDEIEAHHSSLSRGLRLGVEQKLKNGLLRVVVSSTSLELGIDIGYIDLVLLLSSPKSVSRLLQRIGRAGHYINQTSKGRLIAVDRDDLIECTVLAKCALEREIDNVRIPMKPLDVMAQHIVGMSIDQKWDVDEAFELIRRSYNYHDLTKEEFMNVLYYLAGRQGLEEEKVYPKIWFDEANNVFGRKKGSRMIYQLNTGTIPDESKVRVKTRDGKYVGNLEEGFVEILEVGDIFVLGGKTYKFLKSKGMEVIVESAEGKRPTVPQWFSEMLPLSFDSALRVGEFRENIAKLIEGGRIAEAKNLLKKEYLLDEHAANEITRYVWEQLAYIGVVPGRRNLLIEYFKDEEGWNVVFHMLFGRRTNDALSRAYASKLSNKLNKPIKVTVTDNGFMLSYQGTETLTNKMIEDVIESVGKDNLRETLESALRRTEMMRRRFRHVAQRSFMILKRYKGWERSPERMQLSAQKLLNLLLDEIPDLPMIRETYREILEDYMDIKSAEKVIKWIKDGEIRVIIKGPLQYPSPMAHSIVAKGYSDVVLMEDKRKIIELLHNKIMELLRVSGRVAQENP